MKNQQDWLCPKFFMLALAVFLITAAFPISFIDFNWKLISMIGLIYVSYYMVIEFKSAGAVYVSFFYVAGLLALLITNQFANYHTNAVMAFQIATLISIYYLHDYVIKTDEARTRLYESSVIDDLTGVYNKRYFRIKAEQELSRARRHMLRFAIVIIDIDRFKSINDTHGHLMGDQVLRTVAREVEKDIRKEDTFCRYGGDEFVVVVSNYNDLCKDRIANRIKESIRRANQNLLDQVEEPLTVSIGFGVYPEDAEDLDGLFRCADQAMYRKKETGTLLAAMQTLNEVHQE